MGEGCASEGCVCEDGLISRRQQQRGDLSDGARRVPAFMLADRRACVCSSGTEAALSSQVCRPGVARSGVADRPLSCLV